MNVAESARLALHQAGLPGSRITEIRVRDNAMYRVEGTGIVIRVHQLGAMSTARREIDVARWLRSNGIGAAEPLLTGPVTVDGRPVTFWGDLGDGGPASPADVAVMLRTLHTLAPDARMDLPPFPQPEFTLAISGLSVTDADREFLDNFARRAVTEWQMLTWPTRWRPIHGDPSPHNTMATPGGPCLVDLERFALGPAEWDTSTVAVQTDVLAATPEDWLEFRIQYGHDVTGWTGYRVLRNIRALEYCLFACRHAHRSDHARKQARYRIDCLRGIAGPRPWGWVAP